MNKKQLSEAIDLALKGEWDRAHRLVQDLDDATAAWIHGVLHKIEGDEANAQYWYRRANQTYSEQDPKLELASIRQAIESSP
jgi:hypothetical protein